MISRKEAKKNKEAKMLCAFASYVTLREIKTPKEQTVQVSDTTGMPKEF